MPDFGNSCDPDRRAGFLRRRVRNRSAGRRLRHMCSVRRDRGARVQLSRAFRNRRNHSLPPSRCAEARRRPWGGFGWGQIKESFARGRARPPIPARKLCALLPHKGEGVDCVNSIQKRSKQQSLNITKIPSISKSYQRCRFHGGICGGSLRCN